MCFLSSALPWRVKTQGFACGLFAVLLLKPLARGIERLPLVEHLYYMNGMAPGEWRQKGALEGKHVAVDMDKNSCRNMAKTEHHWAGRIEKEEGREGGKGCASSKQLSKSIVPKHLGE